nr:hypothetical protein [Luteimicrobium album]
MRRRSSTPGTKPCAAKPCGSATTFTTGCAMTGWTWDRAPRFQRLTQYHPTTSASSGLGALRSSVNHARAPVGSTIPSVDRPAASRAT